MNLNQSQLDATNIDDYVKQEKRKSKRFIRWNKKNWKLIKYFFCAMFDYDNEREERRAKRMFKSGITFMGIKHYRL